MIDNNKICFVNFDFINFKNKNKSPITIILIISLDYVKQSL